MATQAEQAMAEFMKSNQETGGIENPEVSVATTQQMREATMDAIDGMEYDEPASSTKPTPSEKKETTPEELTEAPKQASEDSVVNKNPEEINDNDIENMTSEDIDKLLEKLGTEQKTKVDEAVSPTQNQTVAEKPTTEQKTDEKSSQEEEKQELSDSPMIPKARLDEVLRERAELRERLDAIENKEKDEHQAQQQQQRENLNNEIKQVDENLSQIKQMFRTNMLKLQESYDEGDISGKEFRQQQYKHEDAYEAAQRDLLDKRGELVNKATQPSIEQQEQNINNDPWLREQTAKLEANNPWMANVPQMIIDTLRDHAFAIMEHQGIPIEPTAQSTNNLRNIMAQIGVQNGFDKVYGGQQQPVNQNTTAPQPNSPTAAERQEKIRMANNHPPSMQGVGVGRISEDGSAHDVESMSHLSADDIADQLPEDYLRKLTGQ